MKVQLCNECGDPLGMCKGALCRKCHKAKEAQKKLEPGSIARAIIAKRAARLMQMIAAPPAQEEPQQNVAVIVTLAADQLAKAWGARVGSKERRCQ